MIRLSDLIEVSSLGSIKIIYKEVLSLGGECDVLEMFYECSFEHFNDIPTGLWRSTVKSIRYYPNIATVYVEGVSYNGRFYETEFDANIAMINDKYE